MLVSAGGSIHVTDGFDAEETLQVIGEHGITELSMVPTMYRRLLQAGNDGFRADLSSVRVARSTGAGLPADLGLAIETVFPGDTLNVLYAGTEAGPVSNLRSDAFAAKSDSVGLPFLGVEVEVRDRGR